MQQRFKRGAKARLQILLLCKTSLTPCQNKVFSARQILAAGRAESRETVTRWARNIRQEIWRNVLLHIRATSRQWRDNNNGNAAERPSRRLARQPALHRTWPRNVRAGNRRDNSQPVRATVAQRTRQHLASGGNVRKPRPWLTPRSCLKVRQSCPQSPRRRRQRQPLRRREM